MRHRIHHAALPVLLLALTAPARAQTQTPSAPGPDLVIFGAGRGVVVHVAADPLLLMVNVLNGAARDAASRNLENRRFVADATASPKFQQLPETERRQMLSRYQQVPIPAVVIGAAGQPIARLFRFIVTAANGRPIAVQARPLASSREIEGPVRLDDRRSTILEFGIDAAALTALAPGRYAISAALGSPGGGGLWQGRVESPALEIDLQADPVIADRLGRLARSSQYFLLDAQYIEAERVAREMIALDAKVVSGWAALGDALAGLARLKEALDAFRRAAELFYAAHPNPGPADEPPIHIEQRILEIQNRIKSP